MTLIEKKCNQMRRRCWDKIKYETELDADSYVVNSITISIKKICPIGLIFVQSA